MITQLLKSAKKKDKKQNDTEKPEIMTVIEEKLRASFKVSELHIKDISSAHNSFQVIVVSEEFTEMKLLER